jgi:uncharacterized damage-inducible protein DinB
MAEILERVDASWQELLAAIDGIPDERMSEPGVAGDWSVKDILAHIAYWEDSLVAGLERKRTGEPNLDGGDYEPINAREHAARADWSLARVREEMQAAHQRVTAALESTPDVDPDDVGGDTWDHYNEHADSIRAWRKARGI